MEQSNVGSRVDAWKQGYERLSGLSMEQLMLIKEIPDDEHVWDNMRKLEDEKARVQSELENIQTFLLNELGEEEMKRIFQQGINVVAESARVLTSETAHKIELLMISTGKELGSTKSQRKVFNAYYGMNSDDQVAYFFDEKK